MYKIKVLFRPDYFNTSQQDYQALKKKEMSKQVYTRRGKYANCGFVAVSGTVYVATGASIRVRIQEPDERYLRFIKTKTSHNIQPEATALDAARITLSFEDSTTNYTKRKIPGDAVIGGSGGPLPLIWEHETMKVYHTTLTDVPAFEVVMSQLTSHWQPDILTAFGRTYDNHGRQVATFRAGNDTNPVCITELLARINTVTGLRFDTVYAVLYPNRQCVYKFTPKCKRTVAGISLFADPAGLHGIELSKRARRQYKKPGDIAVVVSEAEMAGSSTCSTDESVSDDECDVVCTTSASSTSSATTTTTTTTTGVATTTTTGVATTTTTGVATTTTTGVATTTTTGVAATTTTGVATTTNTTGVATTTNTTGVATTTTGVTPVPTTGMSTSSINGTTVTASISDSVVAGNMSVSATKKRNRVKKTSCTTNKDCVTNAVKTTKRRKQSSTTSAQSDTNANTNTHSVDTCEVPVVTEPITAN